MDNQHRKIHGYRELNEREIDLMNRVKSVGPHLEALIRELESVESVDPRWLAMGKTSLQNGLMQLTRSVAKPTFF